MGDQHSDPQLSPEVFNRLFNIMLQITVLERLVLLVPNLPQEHGTLIFADTVSYRLYQKRVELTDLLKQTIGELK